MMRPDDPKERRAIKIVFLLVACVLPIGFMFNFLPWEYTLIFLAVTTPLGAFVRWRWGEAIDRWLLGGD
ncbi:MAG: diacylglycerol kinase [Gemmatimonadetes bacterium]|nr:diacylglycerol kinase [Gemmatimonadota bacterium]